MNPPPSDSAGSRLAFKSQARESTLHRLLTEAAGDVVSLFRVDPPDYLYISDSVVTLTGYTPADYYADPGLVARLIHPDDRPLLRLGRVAPAPHHTVDLRWIHRHGHVVSTEVSQAILTDDSGRRAVLSILRDVSDVRRTASALVSSEVRYRQVFDANPTPMWIFDTGTLAFVAVNDAAMLRYGYSRDEFLQMTIADIRPQGEVDRLRRRLSSPDRSFHAAGGWHHLTRDGRVLDVEVTSHGLDYDGRPCRLAIVHDVTARQRASDERAQIEDAVQCVRKMESVGRLAGGMAHEFNNLLAVIAGFADLMATDLGPVDPEMAGRAQEIVRATRQATDLTRKLLLMSRRVPQGARAVAVDELLREESALVPPLIGSHIDVEVAPGAQGARVRIDPSQLSQILMNLVTNARDAMPDGGTLRLTTRRALIDAHRLAMNPGVRHGAYACLSVEDSGAGMDADVREHLFEPFFTTHPHGQRSGLGLAMVYGIVRQAGGFVEVDSEAGAGTLVTVWLPLTSVAELRSSPEPAPSTLSPPPRTGESVLIVDEDDDVRGMAAEVLTRLGYRVAVAESAERALAAVRAGGPIDLLIAEALMAEMTGDELADRVIAARGPIRVLLTSAYADASLLGRTGSDLPRHLLAKPFGPKALAATVREILDAV